MKPITDLQLSEVMERNVNTVEVNSTVPELIEKIQKNPSSVVVVIEKTIPVGIFTERDLVRLFHSKVTENLLVKEIMSKPVASVSASLSFRSAYIQLCLNRLRHIVVQDEGKVIGVATERDFLGHMGLELFKNVRSLFDLIDKSVSKIPASTSVIDAVDLMIQTKRGCVIVTDGNKLGIFTEQMAPCVLAREQQKKNLTLADVMFTSKEITLDAHISDVISQLVNERIGYVIVTNSDGTLLGTINQSNILESVRAAVYGEMATRQLVEDELLRLEAQLEATLEQTPNVAVQWYDQEGNIHYWNHASEALYSWTAQEAIGKNINVMLPNKKEYQEFHHILNEVKLSGKTVGPNEFSKHDLHGKLHWVESTIFPIPGENNNESYFVCMDIDITKRRQIEKQLIKYQANLEQLVKKRTQELYHQKQKAEQANKSKSTFLAIMSHEIRTPMNAIIGMTDLALKTDLSLKQKGYISKANSSAKALLDIINDILDYSKIEAGKMEIENVNFSLYRVIESTINLVKLKSEENSIKIKVNSKNNVPEMIKGDPIRLGQIILNLLSNAVKFSPYNSEVNLTIKVKQEEHDNLVLLFSVSDSGIGMTPEQQQIIFQSFTQADESTTRQYGGSGLGLSITKQLTDLMEGKIWCESKKDLGTTFYFTTKVKRLSLDSIDSLKLNDEKADSLSAIEKLKHSKILLVEDNEINQELVCELLKMNEIEVVTANNGMEALAVI